jgi:hypothetical protein
MRKVLLVMALLLTSTAFAKTHDYDLEAPCGHVWAAVREVVMHSGKYGVLYMNDKDMTASYNIGGGLTGRRTNTAQLRTNGTGCTMSVQTAFSGLVNKDAGDFLSRVKDARNPPPNRKARRLLRSIPSPKAPTSNWMAILRATRLPRLESSRASTPSR